MHAFAVPQQLCLVPQTRPPPVTLTDLLPPCLGPQVPECDPADFPPGCYTIELATQRRHCYYGCEPREGGLDLGPPASGAPLP